VPTGWTKSARGETKDGENGVSEAPSLTRDVLNLFRNGALLNSNAPCLLNNAALLKSNVALLPDNALCMKTFALCLKSIAPSLNSNALCFGKHATLFGRHRTLSDGILAVLGAARGVFGRDGGDLDNGSRLNPRSAGVLARSKVRLPEVSGFIPTFAGLRTLLRARTPALRGHPSCTPAAAGAGATEQKRQRTGARPP